jgi:hypothetical protein
MEESRRRIHEARRAADERAKTDPKCAAIRRMYALARKQQRCNSAVRALMLFDALLEDLGAKNDPEAKRLRKGLEAAVVAAALK